MRRNFLLFAIGIVVFAAIGGCASHETSPPPPPAAASQTAPDDPHLSPQQRAAIQQRMDQTAKQNEDAASHRSH